MLNEPNWAEQLEAWATLGGAVFAFVGIIIAYISIRNQIREQQSNINTLTGVVETLSKQAEVLGKQTVALSESMKIDSKILNELRKHFADTKDIQILQSEKDKILVKPDIKIDGQGSTPNVHRFGIINEGFGYAKNLQIANDITSDSVTSSLDENFRERLLNDKKDCIQFVITADSDITLPESMGEVIVIYEDIYGNSYSAEFELISKDNFPVFIRSNDAELTV